MLWRRVQHLLVVEFLQEIMEPTGPELIAGEFQPLLGHGQERGARIVVTRMPRQFQALGRRPSELTVLITLHVGITTLAANLVSVSPKNEISPIPALGGSDPNPPPGRPLRRPTGPDESPRERTATLVNAD
jgi:hypothetical protein